MTVTAGPAVSRPKDVISRALSAVVALHAGDGAEARAQIADAQRLARTSPRRHRQIVELAALVVAGNRERAAGLAFGHTAEFPQDGRLAARITRAWGTDT